MKVQRAQQNCRGICMRAQGKRLAMHMQPVRRVAVAVLHFVKQDFKDSIHKQRHFFSIPGFLPLYASVQ